MIKCGNQRSAEEQDGINRQTHADVKPEHRIIVVVLDVLDIDERCIEAAILQIAGNEREN